MKTFKLSKEIKIDDNFVIAPESAGGVTLIFRENRLKEKDNSPYVFEDKWYYASVQDCLEKYVDLQQQTVGNVVDLIEKNKEIVRTINSIKL